MMDRDKDQEELFALFTHLDHPRAAPDVSKIIGRSRSPTLGWMKKAAGFVVAAVLAGAAYAAPGSPLLALASRIFGSSERAPRTATHQTPSPELPISGLTVAAGKSLVIAFRSAQRSGELRVSLGDLAEVELHAIGTGASFTAGTAMLTIDNAGSRASYTIEIPRLAPHVEIRVGDDRVFLKEGARIVTKPEVSCSFIPTDRKSSNNGGIMQGRSITLISMTAAALAGCSDNIGPSAPYALTVPTAWSSAVTNTYLPLIPGTTRHYNGPTSDGEETGLIEVLASPKTINGVLAVEVRDRVYLNGELEEDTHDYFAQDAEGNVWYLGETVNNVKNGAVVSTGGSWQWGVDGALPGIAMWANPADRVGMEYQQEYYVRHAEDYGKVISVNQSATVPAGSFTGCIITEDWTPLEPKAAHENKTYCPGVGEVRSITVGGGEKIELIGRTP